MCKSAYDLLVYDLFDCPMDYLRLPRIRDNYDYNLLIGKRVCFDLDGFVDENFWSSRYGTNSPQCREASTKMFNYLFFQKILQDENSSPFKMVIDKLYESYGILEGARYDINLRASSNLANLNTQAQENIAHFNFLNA